ncbi:MAG: capsular biosynthesis protein [Bryobacteraceae bacterium]|nr:capsular biosynthesis protein [Bryobacteraceae bacterium]
MNWFAAALLLFAQSVDAQKELDAYRRILLDWGGLTRYGSDNYELKQPPQVVFLGDDITENWTSFFPGKPYLNRGITRQTAAQMLVRFRQDVISLKPKAVVIQAGSNDLASVMGPSTVGTMADHYASMLDLARAHGIKVIVASLIPVCDCAGSVQTKRRPPGKIIGLNGWLKDFAAENKLVYLDLYSPLAEGRAMKKDLTADGFLPNEAGYARLAPLAEQAISQALNP